MQQKILLPALLFCCLSWNLASASEVEPNNTKGTANTLDLNGNNTGVIAFAGDEDWWSITTNADGKLDVTIVVSNGKALSCYIYDNDGTTLLSSGFSTTTTTVSKDGLAAGTYYVKLIAFIAGQTPIYTVSNTLAVPAQANDLEPNDNRAASKILPLNGNTTGHAGYYYNLKRDTSDWYKVTTNADGLLRLTLVPANGIAVRIYLYDNDGTTLLANEFSSSSAVINQDGLAPGTYYVRVFCNNNAEFAPYTLSNSLFAYSYANDPEPNSRPYYAKTIPANGTVTGHAGFYYNKSRDSVDWWKINYTGSGNLDFTINLEPLKLDGSYHSLRFEVYKDTAAGAIHSSFGNAASRAVNLTALTQGYYWIKIYSYNSFEHVSYSFSNTFTQANIATIKVTSYDTVGSCSSTNTIKFKCTRSSGPYTVQLYRFGTPYDHAVITSKNATFSNLPSGSYYATAYGDGATNTGFGKSKIIIIEPVPGGLNTTSITATKATLNWTTVSCAGYYTIQYQVHGSGIWTNKRTTGNVNNYLLKNLAANTIYDWRVAVSDSANGITATGWYSDSITFTTPVSLIANINSNEDNLGNVSMKESNTLYTLPNPAINYFTIQYNTDKQETGNAVLLDMNGRVVWSSGRINLSLLNGKKVNTGQLLSGNFYLRIINEDEELIASAKVVITK
jgi:hypothetical protein